MENNWLVRTQSGRILGPIDKKKVISFIEDQSLGEEDELCSGNGHWFYIKEKKLLNNYIYGNATQSFNPVNEAKVVLANQSSKKKKSTTSQAKNTNEDALHFPDDTDLEYPDDGDSN